MEAYFWPLVNHYIDTSGLSKVLSEHTLVPFYRPFLKEHDNKLLCESNLNEDNEFKLLPALQTNMKFAHCWRWCAECAKEDYGKYGVTYWYTYHQIPTMLRCYKHDAALLSKCQSCDFEYLNFQRHWLPPKDGECLECQSQIEPAKIDHSAINNWLHEISIILQQNKKKNNRSVFISLMKGKLGYESLPSNISLALRKEVVAMQVNYESWLQDEIIENYFKRDRKSIFKQGQRVLNIVTTTYRDSQVPPISILLMLKSLGLEHELTKLLLEEC